MIVQTGRYRLTRQTGGRGFYADVTVEVTRVADGSRVAVGPTAFAWLKEVYGPDAWEWPVCDDYRAGAIRGARFALAHASPPVDASTLSVVVVEIRAVVVDTCPDSVAFAVCHATWQALGCTGGAEPRIVGAHIVFDE